jgi:hypothetical protein
MNSPRNHVGQAWEIQLPPCPQQMSTDRVGADTSLAGDRLNGFAINQLRQHIYLPATQLEDQLASWPRPHNGSHLASSAAQHWVHVDVPHSLCMAVSRDNLHGLTGICNVLQALSAFHRINRVVRIVRSNNRCQRQARHRTIDPQYRSIVTQQHNRILAVVAWLSTSTTNLAWVSVGTHRSLSPPLPQHKKCYMETLSIQNSWLYVRVIRKETPHGGNLITWSTSYEIA